MTEASKLSTAYTHGPDLTTVLRPGKEYTGVPMAPDPFGGIYAVMDRHGMLPDDIFCVRCAKPLNAGGRRPAELYAGTFTGICGGCMNEGAYVVEVAVLDGCRKVSWPPDQPSYRRDRRKHLGYEGCPDCQGMGVASYGESTFGRYRESCKACLARYSEHPVRVAADRWLRRCMDSCQAAFDVAMDQAAGVPARCTKKRRLEMRHAFIGMDADGNRSPECTALRLLYTAGYNRIRALIRAQLAAWHHNEWTDVSTPGEEEFFRLYCQHRGFDYDQVMANGGVLPQLAPEPTEREKLIGILRGATLEQVESWYHQGMLGVGQVEWEAYCYAWARSACHYSDQYDGYAHPVDDQVRELGNAIMGDKAPGLCPCAAGESCTR